MRLILIALFAVTTLSACASSAPQAEKKTEMKKMPQCYSGDADKFFNVGDTASIAGVSVTCTATSDGKTANWNSHKTK